MTRRLERLLNDVDRIVLENKELKGYILLTIAEDDETALLYYGQDQKVLLDGLARIELQLQDSPDEKDTDHD